MFNFTNFLRKKWTEYSVASGQKGTTTDELAVKPAGMLLADFYNALANQQAINDISNWQNMTEDQMDFFGNKFFIPRIAGSVATGSMRIFFDSRVDIDITSSLRAQSDTGLLYQAVMPSIISRNSMLISTDPSSKYYVDILIEAVAPGGNYNLPNPNQITSLINTSFTYKMVGSPNPIEGGAPRETNAQYYQRLIYSINDRSLMNKRSLFANLRTYFPYVNSAYIAAPGDKYMIRDLVQARDVSIPIKSSTFLGKIPGDNSVNNSAYYGTFPPEAGSLGAAFKAPFSIYSNYNFPQSVEAINLSSTEVGLHGYPLNQEATSEMYQGLYFDDYRNFMSVQTSDLFNIINENVPFSDIVSPNTSWIIGANGKQNGDYGSLQPGLGAINIIKFNNNNITLAAGSSSSVCAAKDIQKRTGVKLSGTFTTPSVTDDSDSSLHGGLQFMVAGVNNEDGSINAYTGIGFGVRINSMPIGVNPLDTNAVVYFSHSERYGAGQIFAATDDFVNSPNGFVSVGNINALAEKAARLTPGSEYTFEFCLNDDLSLSLYIKKANPSVGDPDDIFIPWFLPPTALNVFSSSINSPTSTNYGTLMRVTLDTKSIDSNKQWVVSSLKAFDIAQHKANSLLVFDIQDLEAPMSISFRGSGSGSVNGSVGSGYSVYIWDTEKPAPAGGTSSLSIGGWTYLEGVSNPSGLKDSITTNLVQDLQNVDQFSIDSRFGKSIILLVTTTGGSEAKIKAKGDLTDDIYSSLSIDYAKVESEYYDLYHANNKTDVYVCTVQNSESLDVNTTSVSKGSGESFFLLNSANGFKMPIERIRTVSSLGNTTQVLAEGTYKVVRSDVNNINSDNETIYLSVDNTRTNSISVEYTTYRSISDIQNFYNTTEFSKLFGNILIKHKFPCYLDINILYTGASASQVVIDTIKSYVDMNNDGIFSIPDLISYLYNQAIVNNVQIPLTINYTKYDDQMNVISGSFTNTFQIRDIDFFRIQNITASKL